MTDGQLRDPKQLVGLARAIDPEGAPERLASGLFVAESVNVIDRALNAGCVPFAVLTDARWLAASEVLLEKVHTANPAAPVAVVSSEEMRSITGYEVTRGPLAAFHRPPEPDLAALLADAHRVAVLEDVTNYTNIGAIFRSAAALGIDAVLLTPACHDPLFRRASRVSMGTVFQVPWARIGHARLGGRRRGAPARGRLCHSRPGPGRRRAFHRRYAPEGGRQAGPRTGHGGRPGLPPPSPPATGPCASPCTTGRFLNVAAASAVAFWETRREGWRRAASSP
ncbi:MAG: TrmH family RNA methyltransferase [Adlercreutzia equolifaciens]